MLKYLILAIFICVFGILIKKDRIYLIPMILIVYTNINGLLDWEDFAFKGLIKFQDYGLVLTLCILFFDRFKINREIPEMFRAASNSSLYKMLQIFWLYYIILFAFSVAIQGGFEWPVKMGRTFFYGWVVFLIALKLQSDPINNYIKIINCLMYTTLVFAVLYIAYNLLGWSIYPQGEQEVYNLGRLGAVKRNFSGFPTFTYYFILLFVHRLISGHAQRWLNLAGLMLLSLCVLLMLTRGAAVLIILAVIMMIFYRRWNTAMMGRIALLVCAVVVVIPFVMIFAEGHYQAMLNRFSEFSSTGISGSSNMLVRTREFSQIMNNLMSFNPVIGFGFTNVWYLGYRSNVLFGGSADNGFSNILGTTGFLGMFIFTLLIFFWIKINLKLQSLSAEGFSKVNFIFIVYMIGSFMNGSGMTYMHTFALFLVYDLLAYYQLTAKKRSESARLHAVMTPITLTTSAKIKTPTLSKL